MEQEPRDHLKTIRQQMILLLCERGMSARDLSQAMGIKEKVVYEHLGHMARSLAAQKKKLTVMPFSCLACGYVFRERTRFTPPGRCPRCKKAHIERPVYRVL